MLCVLTWCSLLKWRFVTCSVVFPPLLSQNDDTGLYSHLTGVPKALLPGIRGKKILDFWWETVNMWVGLASKDFFFHSKSVEILHITHRWNPVNYCVWCLCRRQLFTEVYLVTNADKCVHKPFYFKTPLNFTIVFVAKAIKFCVSPIMLQ